MNQRTETLAKLAEGRATRKTIETLGFETVYWDYQSENQSAKTIVFFHGYRGNHKGLEAIMGALPDFHIIAPDLPGFGESQGFTNDDFSMQHYVEWAAEFIKLLGLKDAYILGHSFSTMLIAAAAGQQLFDQVPIVLINPVSRANKTNWAHKLSGSVIPNVAKLGEPVGRFLLSAPPFIYAMSVFLAKTKDRALRKWIHGQHLAYFSLFSTPKVIGQGFIAGLTNPVNAWAKEIQNPTLLFMTDQDVVTKASDYAILRSEFPQAKVVHLEGIGHLTHYEAPNTIAEAVRDFYNQPR